MDTRYRETPLQGKILMGVSNGPTRFGSLDSGFAQGEAAQGIKDRRFPGSGSPDEDDPDAGSGPLVLQNGPALGSFFNHLAQFIGLHGDSGATNRPVPGIVF